MMNLTGGISRSIRVLIITFLVLSTVACRDATTELETAATDIEQVFGELERDEGYKEGEAFEELVIVRNCNNPLARSDTLIEARKVERADAVSIVGTFGVEVGNELVASAAASIAAGYAHEISEAISRGREQLLPVGANSSMGYVIEWKPRVWSGTLPVKSQSGNGQITYNYTDVEFGSVKAIVDRTIEDCGQTGLDDEPIENGESGNAVSTPTQVKSPPTDIPESTDTPTPTDTPEPSPIPVDTATPRPTSTSRPTATVPANTEPGSELAVGETWIQDGVWLKLESIDSPTYHQHTIWLVVTNKTGHEIVFEPKEASIEFLNQNYGFEASRHSYQPPYPPNRMANGESKRFNTYISTSHGFNPFSNEVDYYYLRVDNFSRISDALWRIDVQH